MESLIITQTQNTPKISFDYRSGKFEISGNSLPEDVLGFYTPIVKWLQEYILVPNPETIIDIRLVYFNSSSSKAILDILNTLEILQKQGLSVQVNWYYMEIDEDMLGTGEEFSEMLNIPFSFFSYMQ